ncbi:N-acetyltransferase family protein [Roseobacter sp. A03A-229]
MKKKIFEGEIRPAGRDDLSTILDMVAQLAAFHGDVATVTPDELARDILGPQPWVRVFLAEEHGVAVGYVALTPRAQMQFGGRGMDMHHLFVAPHARDRGVGRALIAASEQVALDAGCHYLSVGTHPDNHLAQDIYRGMGFDQLDPAGPRFRIMLAAAS